MNTEMSVTGERYQGSGAPVSALYDMRRDFYAFLSKKCFLTQDLRQASVEKMAYAGQLYENSGEAGWIGKNEEDSDFSHAPDAGAGNVLVLRDSAAVKIVLIGKPITFLNILETWDGDMPASPATALRRIPVR
jgi:hypothetical protein